MLARTFVTLLLFPYWAYCSSDYTRPLTDVCICLFSKVIR